MQKNNTTLEAGGMVCHVPFVDFPTCNTAYSDTNWWYNAYTATMEAWWLLLGWDLWRSALKLTRHGLPHTVDAVQFLSMVLYATFECIILLNEDSLRHGGWLAAVPSCCHYLLWFPGTNGVISILASVRSAARIQSGRQRLPKWESRAYLACSAVAFAVSVPTVVVRVLGELEETPQDLLRRCEMILFGGIFSISFVHLVLAFLFIRSISEDSRTRALLKTSKVVSSVGIIVLCWIGFQVAREHSNTWEGRIGDMRMSADALDTSFLTSKITRVSIAAILTWAKPRMRNRLGLQWERNDSNEDTRWVETGEAIMAGSLVLFFSLGLYAPMAMPVASISVFLFVLMFILVFISALWIEKSSRTSRKDLFDLCVSTYLRKRDTVLGTIHFHLLGLEETVFDFCLFIAMPFSEDMPWPAELKNLDFMYKLYDLALNDAGWGTFLTTLVFVYLLWLLLSMYLRAFPKSDRVNQAHLSISWFLYLPCGLATTRLLLSSTVCRVDGTLRWGGTPCDESSAHRAVLIFGISGATWFVLLPSLYFAGIGKFKFTPLIVENPTVSFRNHLLRAVADLSSIYLAKSFMVSRILINLLIVFLATLQQFYDPLVVGHARLNALRAGAFCAALSCHVLAPLIFVSRYFYIPVLMFIPIMFAVGFKTAYKLFAGTAADIATQVAIAKKLDFTEPNLPPRLLGACLHAPPLNHFFRTHLNVRTARAERESTVALESTLVFDDSRISLALTHFAGAISTRCGRRALERFSEYVTAMPQWLDSPQHRSAAIACVLEIGNVEALHVKMRTHIMQALLTAWRLADNDACHVSCSEAIEKIHGMDKIIVCFGPIQQIRRIVIPCRTVWVVPYAPTLYDVGPIDAVLTFPPKWNLPIGDIMPSNVPHFCIPTAPPSRSSSEAGSDLISPARGSVVRSVASKMFSMGQSSMSRRSVKIGLSIPARPWSSSVWPLRANKRLTTDFPSVIPKNQASELSTLTQMTSNALSSGRESGLWTLPGGCKGGSVTLRGIAVEEESATPEAARSCDGEARLMGEDGEEWRVVVEERGSRETWVADDEARQAPLSERQNGGEDAWVVDECAAPSVNRGDVLRSPVTQHRVHPRSSMVSASHEGRSSMLMTSYSETETLTAPRTRSTQTLSGESRKKWSILPQKTTLWGSSLIWRNEDAENGRTHILFQLDDCNEDADDEDGVPTLQLRQALTSFYAF